MHDYGDMFVPTSTTSSSSSSDDFSGHPRESFPEFFPAKTVPFLNTTTTTTPLLTGRKAAGIEYDSICEAITAALSSENFGYSSYAPVGSNSSLVPSYYYAQRPNLIQRCMSSQSLPNESYNPIFSSSSLQYQSGNLNLDLETLPMAVRKAFSTGDLQTINMVQQQLLQQHGHRHRSDSPISNENCTIEGTNKVFCYSAEERKERIERYRSKRSQRNFNKKIKYACRKTLADSRPRIRGRFARNEEIGESFQTQWTQITGKEDEEDDFVWTNFLNALPTNLTPLDP